MFLNYGESVHFRCAVIFSNQYISDQFKNNSAEVISDGFLTDEAGWSECFGIYDYRSAHFKYNSRQKIFWKS